VLSETDDMANEPSIEMVRGRMIKELSALSEAIKWDF
jgi:hypothetical protein